MTEPSPFAAWLGGDPRGGRPAGSLYGPPPPTGPYGAARPPLGSGYYALNSTMQRLGGAVPYGAPVYMGSSHLLAPPAQHPRLAYAPLPPSPYATALAAHPGMVRPGARRRMPRTRRGALGKANVQAVPGWSW